MSEAHLDHPGDWRWFSGHGPRPVKGPCPHVDCGHSDVRAIAYGPDFDHYVLDECHTEAGCNGRCRGWTAEYPPDVASELGLPRFRFPENHLGWLEVEAE